MMLKEKILDLPIEQQVKYANDHLGDLGRFYEKYKNVPAFRQFISEVRSKKERANMDGTVTLPEIFTFIEQNKKLFRKEDVEKLKSVEEAFDGLLPDEELIPQLFFPTFEDISTKEHNTLARGAGNETVYVFGTDPDEPDAPPAYKLDDNGNYVLYDDQLTEQEGARLASLVVLSFNEDVNNPTLPPVDTLPPSQFGPYEFSTTLKLKGAAFTDPKESWVNGKSEINIVGLGYYWLNDYQTEDIDITVRKNNGELKPSGYNLKNVKHKVMKQGEYVNFNAKLITNFVSHDYFAYSPSSFIYNCNNNRGIDESYYRSLVIRSDKTLDFADFVLFEYDTWPASSHWKPLYSMWPGRSNTINDPHRSEVRDHYRYVYRSHNEPFAFYRVYNIYWAHYNDLCRCNGTCVYFLDNTDEDVSPPFNYQDMHDFDHKTDFTIQLVN